MVCSAQVPSAASALAAVCFSPSTSPWALRPPLTFFQSLFLHIVNFSYCVLSCTLHLL